MHERRAIVDLDVRFHDEIPLILFRRLMHLRGALTRFVLRRALCANDGLVNNDRDVDATALKALNYAHQ